MKKVHWLKIALSGLLALSILAGLLLPVLAEIGGTDVTISSLGGGSPDIEVSSNGQFVAVAYFKQENGEGAVYVKSSTATDGWLTSSLVGFGTNPQLSFRAGSNNIIYVVWARSDGAAIQSAQCALAALTPPTCTLSSANVRTATAGSLENPDIAVSSNGFIHVAWVNNGVIETARSTSANSLAGWSGPATVAGGGNDQKPAITWSSGNGGRLHLAFLRGATPTSVEYRHSADTSHSWTGTQNFALGAQVLGSGVHDRLDNPTIAASGSNIFVAFDAHRVGSNNFSLIQATSTDNGSSWADPTYAPSGQLATANDINETKASSAVGVPAQETGLRPSLTISSTSAALVWQEIPGQCSLFAPSTIHFANPPTGAGFDLLSNNGGDDFMVDPDIAVSGSTRHLVFMRDVDAGCPGELAADYVITYRGPFTNTTNDRGEDSNGVFLPLLRKNS
ncbi:MAG: hypothetical protein L6R45_18360 [Anaerolineae bacterium]|nr:hypothetical protein [Anaerolineae bacterium]